MTRQQISLPFHQLCKEGHKSSRTVPAPGCRPCHVMRAYGLCPALTRPCGQQHPDRCRRGRCVDRDWPGLHQPSRHAGRAQQLRPQLQPAHRQGRSIRDQQAQYPEDMRFIAGRTVPSSGGSPRAFRAWPSAWPSPSGPLGRQRLQGQGSALAQQSTRRRRALDAGGAHPDNARRSGPVTVTFRPATGALGARRPGPASSQSA